MKSAVIYLCSALTAYGEEWRSNPITNKIYGRKHRTARAKIPPIFCLPPSPAALSQIAAQPMEASPASKCKFKAGVFFQQGNIVLALGTFMLRCRSSV